VGHGDDGGEFGVEHLQRLVDDEQGDQRGVDDAVGLQQGDPGGGAHQQGGPERQQYQDHQGVGDAGGGVGQVPGQRKADQGRQGGDVEGDLEALPVQLQVDLCIPLHDLAGRGALQIQGGQIEIGLEYGAGFLNRLPDFNLLPVVPNLEQACGALALQFGIIHAPQAAGGGFDQAGGSGQGAVDLFSQFAGEAFVGQQLELQRKDIQGLPGRQLSAVGSPVIELGQSVGNQLGNGGMIETAIQHGADRGDKGHENKQQ